MNFAILSKTVKRRTERKEETIDNHFEYFKWPRGKLGHRIVARALLLLVCGLTLE